MTKQLGFLTFALALTACGVSENNYHTKQAAKTCGFYEECFAAYFNEYYTSTNDCVQEYAESYDPDEYYQDCVFNKTEAKKCLKAIDGATATCDYYTDGLDACSNVWDCN